MNFTDAGYAPQVAAAAGRLEHAAADLRHRAALLTSAAATCEWDGAGARAFRRRSHESTLVLRRAAADLDSAAAQLRRHAGLVADRVAVELAEQAAARERAAHELRAGLHRLGELVGAVR